MRAMLLVFDECLVDFDDSEPYAVTYSFPHHSSNDLPLQWIDSTTVNESMSAPGGPSTESQRESATSLAESQPREDSLVAGESAARPGKCCCLHCCSCCCQVSQ